MRSFSGVQPHLGLESHSCPTRPFAESGRVLDVEAEPQVTVAVDDL